ncbi:hypothetical protein N806_25285 [Rhodococcus sp. P27]|nr:hypothetical protein N806_25285 [Rhodococcus sp. P27]
MNLVRRLSVCTSVVITSALTSVALASAAVTIPFQINLRRTATRTAASTRRQSAA